MNSRVVITGLGVIAPNGCGLDDFSAAIKNGVSGIRFDPRLRDLLFSCQLAGEPQVSDELINEGFSALELRNFNSTGILYGVLAGIEAWKHAGLPIDLTEPDYDSGSVFGAGSSGIDKFRESIYKIDQLQMRKLGSTVVIQTMLSGITAYLGGKLGMGNQVTTNSSACITGAESILMGFDRIRTGRAKRMLCGSTSDSGPYIWAGFDAMKVCTYKFNDRPAEGSRPMSASASGFVPGAGSGALLLESLDSALDRGVPIYAEVLGGHINSGGQRGNGSITAPNGQAVQRCIQQALKETGVSAAEVDVINAHLTATSKDPDEILNWSAALDRKGANFPYVSALKSMTGHCLSGSGSIECVSAVLQLYEDFLFPNLNCEDLHPRITDCIDQQSIPQKLIRKELNILAKASFGFGDINACILFKKYKG